jgi:hypothetical protein
MVSLAPEDHRVCRRIRHRDSDSRAPGAVGPHAARGRVSGPRSDLFGAGGNGSGGSRLVKSPEITGPHLDR